MTTQRRRSLRLKEYDYSQPGAYFVTIVARNRAYVFGEICNGEMRFNSAGHLAKECWFLIPEHFPRVELDAFVVMPNHVHGIISILDSSVGATHASSLRMSDWKPGPPPGSLGAIVGSYKSAVTKQIHELHQSAGVSLWQRNYYEHVIRSENVLDQIRDYIIANLYRWGVDPENPSTPPKPRLSLNVPLSTVQSNGLLM